MYVCVCACVCVCVCVCVSIVNLANIFTTETNRLNLVFPSRYVDLLYNEMHRKKTTAWASGDDTFHAAGMGSEVVVLVY